jgi:hypothetical protein
MKKIFIWIAVALTLFTLIYFLRVSIIKFGTDSFVNSKPFKVALEFARNSPEIKNKIGQIKKIGCNPGGLINANAARVSFDVHGLESSLNVFCILEPTGHNDWSVTELRLEEIDSISSAMCQP